MAPYDPVSQSLHMPLQGVHVQLPTAGPAALSVMVGHIGTTMEPATTGSAA
jgi:hypothetical protein